MLKASSLCSSVLYFTTVPLPWRLVEWKIRSLCSCRCFMIAIYFPFLIPLYFKFLYSCCHNHVRVYIHTFIYDATHSLDRNNLFSPYFLFIIKIMFNCEIFRAVSPFYPNACIISHSQFCQGEFQSLFSLCENYKRFTIKRQQRFERIYKIRKSSK